MICPRLPSALLGGCLALVAACGGGAPDEEAPICAGVTFLCPADVPAVSLASVRERGLVPLPGNHAQGAGDDLVLDNGVVVAVIDAIDSPHLLAPSGGNLLDFAAAGHEDELNQVYQVAGILPDDALHYTTLERVALTDGTKAVVARGTLDGRPDVHVATRYELRRCEQGLRVRTTLYNGGHEPFAFFVADVAYWGGREPLPFTPLPDQGFVQPELELADPDASWGRMPFLATDTGLAWVSCSRDQLEGLNDDSVTAVGEPRQIVYPGERVTYERFLVAGEGRQVESAQGVVQEVRRQLGRGLTTVHLNGSVIAQGTGAPPGTRIDVVASVLEPGGARRPFTQVALDVGGPFALTVPLGEVLSVEAWELGRPVASQIVKSEREAQPLPALEVPEPAHLEIHVGAGSPAPLEAHVVLVPADPATRDAVSGTELGRFGTCAPWLGPPHGASPACNRALSYNADRLAVPAGHYFVYASAGPFWTLGREEVTLAPGETAPLTFLLRDLRAELVPGRLSADLHVHGRASFDSSIPDEDRIRSFVASGVDVIAATDHDAVQDYADAPPELQDRVIVLPGVETTGLIPFMKIPGDAFPRVIGHFNFWPLRFDPTAPRHGAPWDELVEPGALFDLMQGLLPDDGSGLMMLNHPWDEPLFGRDLGYLRAVGFDPRKPIPLVDDGTAQGVLARRPAGGHGNLDFDVLEVLNGHSITKFLQYRQIWWALLAQGRVYPGAANSDSHGLSDAQIGWPRNLVASAAATQHFDARTFDADVRAGHMVGGYGIVLDATLGGAPFGTTPVAPAAGATLDVTVRAAPWIPVTEVRYVVNGRVVRTDPVTVVPADPFGTDDLLRYQASLPVDALLGPGGADAWLLVEAGLPLPAVADLDDDGIVDTTDNDGDGTIDARDIEPGEDSGPLVDPPDPDPWGDDPRRHVAAVAPGTWPIAFTNPFLVDRDGDGTWVAPGL